MLVLLSPAKSLDLTPPPRDIPPSEPVLGRDIGVLVGVMKRKKPLALAKLMNLSDKLATLNHERFQAMSPSVDLERDRPAALMFSGDVYQGLDARSLSDEDLAWAQDHVGILSGLYGVLRPLDLIAPYRLEMGTRLKTRRGTSLYQFWGDRVTKEVTRRLRALPSPVVVNLASQEYARVVDLKRVKAPVVTPVFHELEGDKRQTISFYAKRARGLMARFAVTERLDEVEGLKRFDRAGYRYDEASSTPDRWVFARPKPPPVSAG